MKKLGYTLAEIIIVLVIIGVVVGLVLPMASKIIPDTNKVAFLHTYDSIVYLTHSIVADETFYPEIDFVANDNIKYSNYPLWNINKPPYDDKDYEQAKKYCQILAEGLNANSVDCSNNIITAFGDEKSFTTPNGVDFWINTEHSSEDEDNDGTDDFAIYQSSVYFDVNGVNQGQNCSYNAMTCPHPDRFTLFVASDGKVVAADVMSQHYLDTRTNFSKKNVVSNLNEIIILADADRKKEIEYINEPELDIDKSCGDELPNGKILNCIIVSPNKATLQSSLPVASDLNVNVSYHRKTTDYIFLKANFLFEKDTDVTESVDSKPNNILFSNCDKTEENPSGCFLYEDLEVKINSISLKEDSKYIYKAYTY